MHEFRMIDQVADPAFPDAFLDEVLDSLYVVIGDTFERLDPSRVLAAEIPDESIEPGEGRFFEFQLHDLRVPGQELKPAYLDNDPMNDQSEFAHNPAQFGRPVRITAIDRRDRGEGGKRHWHLINHF